MSEAQVDQSCGATNARSVEVNGEVFWLYPACMVENDLGCP